MATQQQRRAYAMGRLFAAGALLIARQGVATTSVQQIGSQAGMSRGAVNFYFTSKDRFLVALLADLATRGMRELPRKGSAPSFEVWLDQCWGPVATDPTLVAVIFQLAYEALGGAKPLRRAASSHYRRLRVRVEDDLATLQRRGELRDDVDPADVAVAIIGALAGIASQPATSKNSEAAFAELKTTLMARLT